MADHNKDWVLISNDWGRETGQVVLENGTVTDIGSSMHRSNNLTCSLQSEYKTTVITKRHWVNGDNKPNCVNKQCRRKFTLIERQHHCRKCGEIFCSDCLKYSRRLSLLAQFDPEGKLYKVCAQCFEEGKETEANIRKLTVLFQGYKSSCQHHSAIIKNGRSSHTKSWRDKLDLSTECMRLKWGFMTSIGASEMKMTLHEMKELLITPSWQKSSVWMQESMSDKCQVCSQQFGLIKMKYPCKLCAQVLCKSCSYRELLVYLPNDANRNVTTEAELAVIKVIGSPEVEPKVSLLLHVCSRCRQYIIDLQVAKIENSMCSSEANEKGEVGAVSELIQLDGIISRLQTNILEQLPKYQEIVESLENNRRCLPAEESNTKVLAKAQDDLSDYFATLVLKIPLIKNIQRLAETDTQEKLIKNYLKCKSDFYLDQIQKFRHLKRKLSESAPPQVLEYIQKIVDKNAIISVQVYIRQMIFESIWICKKYGFNVTPITDILKPIDQAIEEETKQCLLSQGEDLDLHNNYVKDIIKCQMKEHPLIRLSKRQMQVLGLDYVVEILCRRLCEVIEQVTVQLNMKSINRSFLRSKCELEKAGQQANELQVNSLLCK